MNLVYLIKIFIFHFVIAYRKISADMTENSFGIYNEGVLAAFGDFNSDELTDAFVINNASNLQVYLAYDKEPLLRPSTFLCSFSEFEITSVVPGDFDGDAYMDIMLTTKNILDMEDIRIIWGGMSYLNCSDANEIKAIIKGQPLIMDYNRNMILDLFGVNSQNQRAFWVFDKSRSVPLEIPLVDNVYKDFKMPHSHSFMDINGDNAADLLLTTIFDIEVWLSDELDGFKYFSSIPLAIGKEYVIFGQVLFLDVALAGDFYPVIPTCYDSECHNSTLLIYDKNNWHDLHLDLNDGKGTIWRFVPPREGLYMDTITMRSGDFNMDGYPDILMTLSPQNSNETNIFLLHNVKCDFPECKFHRTFIIQWDKFGTLKKNVVLGTFYDFYMDGVLDIIYVEKNATTQKYSMHAFKNELEYDTNFIKVIVVTGLTNAHMPVINRTLPLRTATFGTNLPGPRISYETWSEEGTYRTGVCAQLSQSAYFALQLPYSIFGLDRTPNFVETLNIGLSGFTKSWTQIIPNSQIVVIPAPPDNPSEWRAQLFVTPSKLIIKSLFVLTAILVIITGFAIYFHWKEKKEGYEDIVEIDEQTYIKI